MDWGKRLKNKKISPMVLVIALSAVLCMGGVADAIVYVPDGTGDGYVLSKAELQEETATILEGKNIRYTWENESQKDEGVNYTISVEGEGLDEFNQSVLSKICLAELLEGPTSLYLTGKVSEGQVLVLSLDTNPSTGYLWKTAEMNGEILRQAGKVEFKQESELLGAPGKQILRFESIGTGQTNLKLIYHRPWEKDTESTREIYIQAVGIDLPDLCAQLNNLTPDRTPSSSPEYEYEGDVTTPAAGEHPIASPNLGLPEAFNWCDNGGCTPVKDQGACGSCWAFGTVAPLESNIKIKDGVEENLAEQYLVSCNTDGWGCDGGWWAHNYHWWKIPPGESEAGAVLEEEFPYQANDVPCCGPCPFSHPYELDSWSWVEGGSGVPSVADMKQAIYTYGPISVAICAGSAFGSYGGGVFETDEACAYSVNHAVALVGWDDSQGTNGVWILRNSWGPGWGESGYMRIGYGVSNVGYSANYIVYDPGPAPNMPSAPSPGNHTTGVSVDTDLNWSGGDPDADDTVNYTVYFGTNSTPPFRETIGPYAANQTSISYSPGTLSYNSTYYWKIAATDNHGVSTTGPVWDFTTQQAPAVTYNLTISNTSGGTVTTPGGGTFTCNDSEVVDLIAAADSGYYFVNWTGDVGTIGDADSATTNIIMYGNYSIMADFGVGQGWGFEIQPNVNKKGFNEDFAVNATATRYSGESDSYVMYVQFNGTLLDVTGVDTPATLPNGMPPFIFGSPTWDNTTGWVRAEYSKWFGSADINETFTFCTIHFRTGNVPGTTYLNFTTIDPGNITTVMLVGVDCLNWTHVANGTVEVVSGATLQGNVTFPGRGTAPSSKWIEDFVVRFFQDGSEVRTDNVTTDNTGVFLIHGIVPGTYDISIKNWTCLSELESNVTLTAGNTTVVDFGTTREGDSNNNDYIVMADLSLLLPALNTQAGEPAYSVHYDFNRDGWITMADLSLMLPCWNQHGDLP